MAIPPPKPGRPQAAPALFRLLSDSALSRAALNACGVPLALLDADKRTVAYVNAAFTAYFGFGEGEALGRSIGALLLRGDEALAQRVLADCPSTWQLTAWRKDRAALQLQLALSGVRGADGRLTHWVLTFSDQGELERLRAEVESLKAVAANSLGLRLDAGGQPARGAQQPGIEAAAADELHAERQPIRRLHQR
jgi:nitrogen-specific signal transduction histidine kinase